MLFGIAVGAAAWFALRRVVPAGADLSVQGFADSVSNAFVAAAEGFGFMPFSASVALKSNAIYVDHIRAVERSLGLPADLLVRVAYQESRFRADIISGAVRSSAGAAGMFQLMPVHWKEVDPLNWQASAAYAGRYLKSLFKQFGQWSMALAAYNWGPGNLARYGIESAPLETRNYYSQILADVGGGIVAA
jgi:soluble lytic murein transglycosylase-like protein